MDAFELFIFVSCLIFVQLTQVKGSSYGNTIKIVNRINSETYCSVTLSECDLNPTDLLMKRGPKGDTGDDGPAGAPAICNCPSKSNGDNERGDAYDKPLKTTCKNSPAGIKPQWIGKNQLESFKIQCEMDNFTCIAREKFLQPVSVEVMKTFVEEHKFIQWNQLAEYSLMEMLGMQPTQITWLHGLVNSARQTIRVRGLDITQQNKDTVGTLVTLLTWNDVKIGNVKSETTPFYYKVEIPQSCENKNPPEACEYIDLKMKTDMVGRLPVTDIIFNFGSIEKDKKISVEIVELCFE